MFKGIFFLHLCFYYTISSLKQGLKQSVYIYSGLACTKPAQELNTASLVWLITIFSKFALVKCVLQDFDVLLNNFILLLRALRLGYLTQDMIDDYEPALMFTIPRLAIVW